jgi:hypothetical protein
LAQAEKGLNLAVTSVRYLVSILAGGEDERVQFSVIQLALADLSWWSAMFGGIGEFRVLENSI